ncbi:MAG: amidohydrolase family protein [Bacteroidetes bacterium]|nr:amidohydrolase family protein [Bacteroidota bacterium]
MKRVGLALILSFFFVTLSAKIKVDLIVFNAVVYTVDSTHPKAEAFAVNQGKFVAVGSTKEILKTYESKTEIDAQGKPIYPGFIDAHCHFLGYGLGLQKVNVVNTKSQEEVIEIVKKFYDERKPEWLLGRGWDQNDWKNTSYPLKDELDVLFPHTPVVLKRVDGHAAWVNSEVLRRAGITINTKVEGGEIIINHSTNEPSGVLIDNAVDLVEKVIPKPTQQQKIRALLEAEKNCLAVGLTTIDDAGLDWQDAELIDSMQKAGALKIKVYLMLSGTHENYMWLKKHGTIKTPRLTIRAFKFYADGALGSRGALLKKEYSDEHGHTGLLLTPTDTLKKYAKLLLDNNWQMCTHCIGDSANALLLNVYRDVLKTKNDRRWRIEHAQVIDKNDFHLFGDYSIIPSVQPTHATSDAPWAGTRLGDERVKGAYAYKDLLNQNGWLAAGSDFPVEDIDPIEGFYSAFTRESIRFYIKQFQPINALSRIEALKAMTIWAAKSNFEEKEKGSITVGKSADFVMLNCDIMTIENFVFAGMGNKKIIATYVNGEKVYAKPKHVP